VFLTTWQPELTSPQGGTVMGHDPQIDLTMPGHRQRGPSSVEGWHRAVQCVPEHGRFLSVVTPPFKFADGFCGE